MELTQNDMLQLLDGLILPEDEKTDCGNLWTDGNYQELCKRLRSLRGNFLENLHESQQRLDQLDYLIYSMKRKNKDRIPKMNTQ